MTHRFCGEGVAEGALGQRGEGGGVTRLGGSQVWQVALYEVNEGRAGSERNDNPPLQFAHNSPLVKWRIASRIRLTRDEFPCTIRARRNCIAAQLVIRYEVRTWLKDGAAWRLALC